MKAARFVLLAYSILLLIASTVNAQLAGKYSDGKLIAEFADSSNGGGGFTGTLTLNGQPFSATAHTSANGFDGSFTSGGNNFTFTASLAGDSLTLITGGVTYTLKKAAKNPLAGPKNPLAGAAAASDPSFPGYTITASTDFGKSLVGQKPDATTVQAALESTLPDLARYFGNRPKVGHGYADARNHGSGGATFTATLNGHEMTGFISCKITERKGATVAVIFARADISKDQWNQLANPQPPAPPQQTIDVAKVLGSDAQKYDFPDGTGSVMLAAGWKTQAQSAISPVMLTGPNDQTVMIGNAFSIQTPDSPLMKMVEHNEAMMRRMGGNPPPRPPILVAEYTDPIQAMKDLGPQVNKINEARGNGTGHLDEILSHQEIPCDLKDGQAALVSYDVTRNNPDGRVIPMRAIATIHMCPIGNGTWMYCFTGCIGPRDRFDQDRPIMLAMLRSEKVNADICQQRMREQNDRNSAMLKAQADASNAQLQRNHDQFMRDQQQRFEDGQARHAEQMAGYERHNQQWAADELQKSRNNADFVETIRGTRTIYDTKTGQTGTADLNYSTGVVNALNEATLDPNRFVEVPLRDEMYPMPGNAR